MTRRPRRGLGAITAGAFLLVGSGAAASAVDEPLTIDTLPAVADAEVNALRTPIEVPERTPIDVPEIVPFEPEVTSSGGDTVVSLNTDVLFDFGEAQLAEPAQKAVGDAVRDIPDDAKVAVEGHTDSIGADVDNLRLSKQRAQAVADVITTERTDLKVTVTGLGEKKPAAANDGGGKDNPEGREKNRRVEIRYAD